MTNKHYTVPIFVPHLGCPHNCIFCNQHSITGVSHFDLSLVSDDLKHKIDCLPENVQDAEIAFFGGSFTGIDESQMIYLLEEANKYYKSKISSIRCSTRPDYINCNVLKILKYYNVKTIELGIQSMNDDVLYKCQRGHDSECSLRAMEEIVSNGFDFVGQMMVGLPGATLQDEINCAEVICKHNALGTRIYPTVVFKNTILDCLVQKNEYIPLNLSEAIFRSAEIAKIFIKNKINILRIGLCESIEMHDNNLISGGPLSPSIGEMVFSKYYYDTIRETLHKHKTTSNITVLISPGHLSKVIGHKKTNHISLTKEFNKLIYYKESDKIKPFEIEIQ